MLLEYYCTAITLPGLLGCAEPSEPVYELASRGLALDAQEQALTTFFASGLRLLNPDFAKQLARLRVTPNSVKTNTGAVQSSSGTFFLMAHLALCGLAPAAHGLRGAAQPVESGTGIVFLSNMGTFQSNMGYF